MRRALRPPFWPPEPGADVEVVTLTLVSGPFEHEDDAGFPGVKRYRAWLRWYDDRTGWRTHLIVANPHVLRRYWYHAGRSVRVYDGVDQRCEAPGA